jgi:flagellar basal body L-ring protein FlgH
MQRNSQPKTVKKVLRSKSIESHDNIAQNGSLWPSNASSFCDQTSQKGDIVVVEIDTNDTGQWQDSTNLQRKNNGTDLTSIVKSGASLLTNKINLGNVDLKGVNKHNTSAGSKQMVRIKAQIPAIVQHAERGKVYVAGAQEITFGGERRSVEVRGFCRATDIQHGTIKFSRLAEGQLYITSKGDYDNLRRLPWSQRMLGRFGLW